MTVTTNQQVDISSQKPAAGPWRDLADRILEDHVLTVIGCLSGYDFAKRE